MLLATQTDRIGSYFSDFDAIEMIADAGFDSLDYSMFRMSKNDDLLNSDDFKPYVLDLLETAKRKNITFTQGHAPFSFSRDDGEQAFIDINLKRAKRSIEIASILGIDILVVHPLHFRDYYKNKEFLKEVNMNYYRELIPYCEKYGVKIACENMWQYNEEKNLIVDSVCSDPFEFSEYIDEISSEFLVGCLDLGHCPLTNRNADDCLKIMGSSRVKALHVHDNDLFSDSHTLPFFGKTDWNAITKSLADTGYSGNFTFEADNFLNPFTDKDGAQKALEVMEYIGRKLIKQIEEAE